MTNAMSGEWNPDAFKGFQRKFDFSDFPRSLRYVDLSGSQFDGVDHFPAGLVQSPAEVVSSL